MSARIPSSSPAAQEMRSVVTFRAPGYRSRRHLREGCRHLARARHVTREREQGLWPGSVCDTCRREAGCRTCGAVWPYSTDCACVTDDA